MHPPVAVPGSSASPPDHPVIRIGGLPAGRVEEFRAELDRWLLRSELPFRTEVSDRTEDGDTVVLVPVSGRSVRPTVELSVGALLASEGMAGLLESLRSRLTGGPGTLPKMDPGPLVPTWCDPP